MFNVGDRVVVLEDDGKVKAGMFGTVEEESSVPWVYVDELKDKFVLLEKNLRLIKEPSKEDQIIEISKALIKKDKEIANLKGQLTAYEKIFKLSACIKK